MTHAHQDEAPRPVGSAGSGTAGRDRRVHHRRETSRVWVQIDGGWYTVHDLSLGGLALDRPVGSPDVGGTIEGEIHSRAADRNLRTSFEATIVRIDADDRIGVAFAPMAAEQIDGLLAVLSAVEREFVQTREAALRHEELQRRLRRLGLLGLGLAGAVGLGYIAWIMR